MSIRLFSNGLGSWRDGFHQELQRQLERLGIDPGQIPLLETDPDPIPPHCLVLYFADGSFAPEAQDLRSLRKYLEEEIPVIPVLDSTKDAANKLPAILQPLNAFALGMGNYKALVDEVLAQIWLARTSRKIFISYKREDSFGAAHALRDLLFAKGFEVFLDDSSIPPGKHFQRELFWWMNDADLVLLLASPNFRNSQWILREIQFATLSSIGLLAVLWPGSAGADEDLISRLHEDQVLPLTSKDFTGSGAASTLAGMATLRLLDRIAELRARLVQHRLIDLLRFLQTDLARQGYELHPQHRLGDFEIQKARGGPRSFLRVLPFRPTVETVDDLRRDLAHLADPPSSAFLYYQENDVGDRRLIALEWLLSPLRRETPSTYRLLPYNTERLLV